MKKLCTMAGILVMAITTAFFPGAVFAIQVSGFQDIDRQHWAYSYVQDVVEQGLFLGVSDTAFEPETAMSRAMFVTVLHRYDGAKAGGAHPYSDVPADAWYAEAAGWAASLGLLEDIAEEDFNPEASITREDMMTLLYRYFGRSGSSFPTAPASSLGMVLSDFTEISPYARDAVVAGCWARIMEGFPDGRFSPQGESTRAQVAAVFSRSKNWQQIRQNPPHASEAASILEKHSYPNWQGISFEKMRITANGFLAAWSDQGKALLIDLNTRRTVAEPVLKGSYCRFIGEDADGVIFYTIQEEDYPAITSVNRMEINWQGETKVEQPDAFRLPFAGGFIEEWEADITFLDAETGERRVLAEFAEAVEASMGGPAYLTLCDILDEHRFVYTARLDAWSLGTYVYDMRTKQNAPAPFNIYLGHGGSRLLGSFGSYGLEGMAIAELDSLDTASTVSYNDAGPSRAVLSGDGSLILAVYHRGEDEKGLLVFAAQTGQLLETYELTDPVWSGIYHYGFWGQRPYFVFADTEGETQLWILPENAAGFDMKETIP